MRRQTESRSLGDGENTMRSVSVMLTLLHKDNGVSTWGGSSGVSFGESASRRLSRRMAFTRRLVLEISCMANLGHMWRGSVLLVRAGVGFWGVMVVAVGKTSLSMVWRS